MSDEEYTRALEFCLKQAEIVIDTLRDEAANRRGGRNAFAWSYIATHLALKKYDLFKAAHTMALIVKRKLQDPPPPAPRERKP